MTKIQYCHSYGLQKGQIFIFKVWYWYNETQEEGRKFVVDYILSIYPMLLFLKISQNTNQWFVKLTILYFNYGTITNLFNTKVRTVPDLFFTSLWYHKARTIPGQLHHNFLEFNPILVNWTHLKNKSKVPNMSLAFPSVCTLILQKERRQRN